jgi:DNA (cytosine-5)-methyltransferase 1
MGIRVFTAFSGYDSQCMALEKAGIQYDLVGWSEIDKWAIQAHNAVFPQYQGRNFGDITKIDWIDVPDFDLFTYSSPCQDFSKAGKMRGGQENSGTRSSLLWVCREAIRFKRPKMCILENVENLVSDKFYPLFREWEQLVASLGYSNYIKVINAVDAGVPQNRKRVFLVSILDQERYFEFPSPVEKISELDEFLDPDDQVDEKYYIPKDRVGILVGKGNHLWVRNATAEGYAEIVPGCLFDSSFPNSKTRRGRVQGGGFICPTLTTKASTNILRYFKDKENHDCFRRLTERECFRLQGVSDGQIDLIQAAGISGNQQYCLAGNSICVDVMVGIFKNLIQGCEKPEDYLF